MRRILEKDDRLLQLHKVSTSYGRVRMLQEVCLEVRKGEIVCLLGPNGAGKSTTIKTILGLVKPDLGEITFKDKRIDGLDTHRIVNLGVAIVPEGRRLFPRISVGQNLRLGASSLRDEHSLQQRYEEIFGLFPVLRERLNQATGTLSGGEQAMVAIGRAMVSNPDLLILDEPSFGLAPILVEQFYVTIRSIRERGTTILLSEQNAGMALATADRGYVLQKGAVRIQGETGELRRSEVVRKAYLGES